MFHRADQDEQIIRRVLSGRTEDFSELVDRYLPAVRALARTRLAQPHEADDVAQDAFIKAYQELDALRNPRRFAPWLFTITRNACANRRRAQSRVQEREQAAAPDPVVAPPDVERAELHALLLEKLNALDEGERDVLLLHYFANRKVRDIASMLDISTAAAKKRLQRAREALGESLMRALAPEFADAEDRKLRVREVMQGIAAVPVAWKGTAAGGGSGAAAAAGGLGLGAKLAAGLLAAIIMILLSLWSGMHFSLPRLSWTASAPATEQVAAHQAGDVPEASSPDEAASTPAEPAATASVPPADQVNDGEPSPTHITVLDDQGHPAPGVRVRAFNEDFEHKATDGTPVLETTTGEDGSIDLRPDGAWLIEASDEGRRALAVLSAACVGPPKTLSLKLLPVATAKGTVRDADGEPVQGAKVVSEIEPIPTGPLPNWAEWVRECTAMTDRNGAFEIKGMPASPSELTISAPNRPTFQRKLAPTSGVSLDLTFPRGARISGQVVDAGTGAPVPGLALRILDKETVTDAKGRFASPPFHAGRVIVGPAKGPYLLAEPWKPFSLDDGEDVENVRVEVRRGGAIEGHLYDADSGKDAQANIELWSPPKDTEQGQRREIKDTVYADVEGNFRMEGIVPGTYVVGVGGDYWRDDQTVTIDWGSVVTVDGAVRPRVSVSGTVVAEDGQPVPAADVNMICGRVTSGTRTDSNGTFEFSGLRPGEQIELVAGNFSHGTPYTVPTTPLDGIVLKLRLSQGGNTGLISGRLLDTDGNAIPNATVTLMKDPIGSPRKTTAFADGHFEFTDLPAGAYKLYAGGEMGMLMQSNGSATKVMLRAGEHKQHLDLVSDRVGNLSVAGKVLDENGDALGGARVHVTPVRKGDMGQTRTGEFRETTTAEDGSFALSGFPKGTCILNATIADRKVALNDVQAGTTDLVIAFPPRAMIQGRVVGADTGAPITTFGYAMVFRPGPVDTSAITSYSRVYDEAGRFSFPYDVDKQETIRVAVRAERYAPAVGTTQIGPGISPEEMLIKLTPALPLRGRVTSPNGDAISGARVAINRPPDASSSQPMDSTVQTDNDGWFEFASVPTEAAEVFVAHTDYAPARVAVGDRSHPLSIVMNTGGIVEGHVRDHGVAIVGCNVSARASGFEHGMSSHQKTDDQGAFRIEGLPAGPVTLEASISSSLPDPNDPANLDGVMMTNLVRNATVQAGATTQVDFDTNDATGIVEGRVALGAGVAPGPRRIMVVAAHMGPTGTASYSALQFLQQGGPFQLNVPPGETRVTAKMLDGETQRVARADVMVQSGQTTRTDLVIGGGSGTVRCTVTGLSRRAYVAAIRGDAPLPEGHDASVSTALESRTAWLQEIASDGMVEATGLVPGTYTVALGGQGAYWYDAVVVEVPDNGAVDAHLAAQ